MSGGLNLLVMPWVVLFVVGMGGGTVCGILTIWMGGLGAFCGMCGWLGMILVPVGIFEIVAGVMGLTNPQTGGKVMRIATFVEMGSIIVGGLTGLIAGIIAMMMLRDPEVAGYIDTAGQV